jgi:hypothetical protein
MQPDLQMSVRRNRASGGARAIVPRETLEVSLDRVVIYKEFRLALSTDPGAALAGCHVTEDRVAALK